MCVRIIGNEGLGRKYSEDINGNYRGLHHYFKINSTAKIVSIGTTTVYVIQDKYYQTIDINDIRSTTRYSKLEIL